MGDELSSGKYEVQESPFLNMHMRMLQELSRSISNNILNAIPGYWEDMSEKFKYTSSFINLESTPVWNTELSDCLSYT